MHNLILAGICVILQWVTLAIMFRTKSNKKVIFWVVCNLILMVLAFLTLLSPNP